MLKGTFFREDFVCIYKRGQAFGRNKKSPGDIYISARHLPDTNNFHRLIINSVSVEIICSNLPSDF